MKLKLLLMAVAMAVSLGAAGRVQAHSTISVGIEIQSVHDFYEPLRSDGYWVESGRYGRCWYPAYVDHD